MRSVHGTHLQSNGSGGIAAHRNQGAWERWVFEPASAGRFFISNTPHNVRVCASDNKKALPGTVNRSKWEEFRLVDAPGAPGKYCIATAHGTFLSCENDRVFQSPNQSAWEQWEILPVDGGLAKPRAEAERKLAERRRLVEHTALSLERGQHTVLAAELQRRTAAKIEFAARLDAEIAQLASP